MSHESARVRKSRQPLTPLSLLQTLKTTLPRRNGYKQPNCEELISEATHFGIATPQRLRKLLLKHRRALITDDRETLQARGYMHLIAEEFGESYVTEMKRKQRCFTWEGLMRNAFGLELGELYEAYARERDGI